MLSFIKRALVMVSVHSRETLTKTEVGNRSAVFCDRHDHAFIWKNVDIGTLDLKSYGML